MPAPYPTPLHSRMLAVRLGWGEDGDVVATGRIVDLRKRGLVPLVGKLQGPGIVHDMSVQMRLSGADLRIVSVTPSMAAYPFAATTATRGEACPQILPRVQQLVGTRLAEGYDPDVVAHVGGPRGCFHVFTLLRLLGPAVVSAMRRERRRREQAQRDRATPAVGAPIFARSVIIDGIRGDDMRLGLHATLFDLDYALGAETLPIDEEMAESFEANAEFEVEIPGMAIRHSAVRTRHSGHAIAEPGVWSAVALCEQLVGVTMYKGYTAEVQRIFAGSHDTEALQHLLFMLAPAMLQCMPSLFDEIEWRPRRAEGSRGAVDSCHMWRADGPLMRD